MKLDKKLIFLILGLILYFLNSKDNFENGDNYPDEGKPDDLFTDGLDHSLGLNKKHRHHSF